MDDFPDAVANILLRLPLINDLRRLRLVCRFWRDLIDEHADMQIRSKVLAVTTEGTTHVVDVLSPGSPAQGMWQSQRLAEAVLRPMTMSVVGTCNGLVCVCDDQVSGGAITLSNPATREELRLPPLPRPSFSVLSLYRTSSRSWYPTYCFARHPTTGRYKVVHVPNCFDPFWEPGVVHVFTLGEPSWRDVHLAPADARCSLGVSSLVDVDGTVYWMTEDAGRIVAFDLEDERITGTMPLPVPAKPASCRLTKVHARLGVAVGAKDDSTPVWVLEGESWSRLYVLEAHILPKHQLVFPHCAIGEYILTQSYGTLYRHKIKRAARSQGGTAVVQINGKDPGEEVTSLIKPIYRMYAYVHTKEPLSVYKLW